MLCVCRVYKHICRCHLYPSAKKETRTDVDGPFSPEYHRSRSILTHAMRGLYVQGEYDRYYHGDIHQIEGIATDLVSSVLDSRKGGHTNACIRKSNMVMLISNWAGAKKWASKPFCTGLFTPSLLGIVDLLYSRALSELECMGKDNDNGCAALMSLVKLQRLSRGGTDNIVEFPLSDFLNTAGMESFLQTGMWSLFSDGPTEEDQRATEISRLAKAPYAMAYNISPAQSWLHENIRDLE